MAVTEHRQATAASSSNKDDPVLAGDEAAFRPRTVAVHNFTWLSHDLYDGFH